MPVYVDDEPVAIDQPDLRSLLAEANERLSVRGRMVVEVHLDGEMLAGERLDERSAASVIGSDVRLYSEDPRSLSIDALGQVRELLEQIKGSQAQAAQLLQQDQHAEAMTEVGQVVESWRHVQEAVLNCGRLAGLDLDAKSLDGKPLTEMTGELVEQVKDLRDLIQSGDTVGIADAFAYEWPQTAQRWDRLIEQMIVWLGGDEVADGRS